LLECQVGTRARPMYRASLRTRSTIIMPAYKLRFGQHFRTLSKVHLLISPDEDSLIFSIALTVLCKAYDMHGGDYSGDRRAYGGKL
jgi:hypothetical protein